VVTRKCAASASSLSKPRSRSNGNGTPMRTGTREPMRLRSSPGSMSVRNSG